MIWNEQRILQAIQKLYQANAQLSYNALSRRNQALLSAAAYHFGSYRRAVEKAGIDYAAVLRRPRWSKNLIIAEVKKAKRAGIDLHWSAVTKRRDELARRRSRRSSRGCSARGTAPCTPPGLMPMKSTSTASGIATRSRLS